jgi:hypothetical protein
MTALAQKVSLKGRTVPLVALLTCFWTSAAIAAGLADLTSQEASRGIKGALVSGVTSAVGRLGVPGGFLNNEKVKIPLPPALKDVAGALHLVGRGKDADELVTTMNRAAEQAVPQAKEMLVAAVRTMSIADAKQILTGGDDSVTQFFRAKTAGPLAVKFLPVVKRATQRVGLAKQYDELAARGAQLGLVKGDTANIEQYVTDKTLDGLYLEIGEEERAIRKDPAAAGSAIVAKVFGALR